MLRLLFAGVPDEDGRGVVGDGYDVESNKMTIRWGEHEKIIGGKQSVGQRVGKRDLWRGDARRVERMNEALHSGVYQHWKREQAGSGAGSGAASRATSAWRKSQDLNGTEVRD